MMQEVERMSKLSNKDRELLQSIQEGVSGVRPITPEWINNIVKSLKERPDVFKQMLKGKGSALGGMSDEQIESYIDMGSGMSEFFLQCIAFGIWYLTKAMKPLSELYTTIDKYTFNSARYIFLAFFGVLFYYFAITMFFVLKFLFVQIYAIVLLTYATIMGNNPIATGTEGTTTVLDSTVEGGGGGGVKEVLQQAAATVMNAATGNTNTNTNKQDDYEF